MQSTANRSKHVRADALSGMSKPRNYSTAAPLHSTPTALTPVQAGVHCVALVVALWGASSIALLWF
jgi:hypothetical protein